ncbi:MAG: ribosome biogenesis factor YjgA [Burkholderiales bacterium]
MSLEELPEPPSKTQRKNEMHALQDLGTALSALSPERIRSLQLPETLEHALLEVKKLKAHGAIRRQLQYIGRLMRDVDPAPLQAHLDALAGVSRTAVAAHHLVERWRARMMEDLAVVDEFAAIHREADRQQLRQIVLAAQRERIAQKPPRQYRELFRTIAHILATTEPTAP